METKSCQFCKKNFTLGADDFAFFEKLQVPPPTWCTECRLIRRLSWRNERSLYKRKCGLCVADIIAMYSPDGPFQVYCPPCFYSDKWDPTTYGREYDFSRPFFVQLQELQHAIPHIALLQGTMVNSPWCNYELEDKNCYLNFGGQYNEDGAYSQYSHKTKEVLDSYWLQNGELGYESMLSDGFYKLFYSRLCYGCQDTYFSFDCKNCSNIFGCSGLRSKEYCIYNQQITKAEFEKFMQDYWTGSYTKLAQLIKDTNAFWQAQPQRALLANKSVASTGSLLDEAKNCTGCVLANKVEDSKNLLFAIEVKDSMDVTSVWGGELLYDCLGGSGPLGNNKFSFGMIENCMNVEYSCFVSSTQYSFGSFNLKRKEYCILNKQYAKEEYVALHEKIIQHMNEMPYVDSAGRVYKYGEFLPMDVSPFGYNETVAQEYFPLTREEAGSRGLAWHEAETGSHQFSEYQIPDNINDIADDILDKVLKCEASGKAYRLTPQELAFYRRFNLPVPRLSSFERHKQRLKFIAGQLKSYTRTCGKCQREIGSVYSEIEFPKVYCEECYLSEIA